MSRLSLPWSSISRAIAQYALAILIVAAVIALALLVEKSLHSAPFVSLFLCAILLIAWIGGAGPGLFATGLFILGFYYFFIPPSDAFVVQDAPRILLFALTAFFVIWVCAAQRRTAQSLRRARDDLRVTVQELENLNRSLQAENTERLRAEQAARQAEREVRLTIDTIPAIAARYRADGSLEFVNQTWRTYTGLTQENLPGHRWGVAIHPDDLPKVEAAWRAHLPTGETFQMEQRMQRADGQYRWHWVRRVPLRDENGNVIRWYGVAHDIEDQKLAEHALQRSESYLAEAQRLSKTGSFGWKIGSNEIFWSKETYRIMGFDESLRPTLGLLLQRVHPDDRGMVKHHGGRAVRGQQDFDYEYRLLTPDGDIKHIHVRAHRQVYAPGEEELVGALMDVTESRKAQEALQSAQTALAHVTRVAMLGEMSASIAHEVNQPLAAIVTSGEAGLRWLSRRDPDIEEAVAVLRQIVHNAHRASDVIRRIREFSQKADPDMVQLDINEVVKEVVMLLRHEALRDRVAIRLELATGLPSVRGDCIQLQQVIINLAINGMQAMTTVRDRERVLVLRTQQHASDQVLVTVEDVGIGIAPENAGRLFSAFYTTRPEGLGMGLSICRSIIEAHGGRIWAFRHSGPGMTFQFTLPT